MIYLNLSHSCDPEAILFVIHQPFVLNNYKKSEARCGMWAKNSKKDVKNYNVFLIHDINNKIAVNAVLDSISNPFVDLMNYLIVFLMLKNYLWVGYLIRKDGDGKIYLLYINSSEDSLDAFVLRELLSENLHKAGAMIGIVLAKDFDLSIKAKMLNEDLLNRLIKIKL